MTLVILLIELSTLYWLRQVGSRLFSRVIQRWGGSIQLSVWIYSVITLPGVLVHEMSHFLMAILVGFRTGKIELLPILNSEGGVELGSVQVESGDPVRLSLVGLAPLIMGTAVLILLAAHWQFSINQFTSWLIGYLMVTIGLHVFPSQKDMAMWPVVGLFISVIGLLIWWWGIRLPSFRFWLPKLHFIGERLDIAFGLALVGVIGCTFALLIIQALNRFIGVQLKH